MAKKNIAPSKAKGGRPRVITPGIVRKLTEAFKLDVTVQEACLYAGIAKDTYYRKLKDSKKFSDEMEQARMYASLVARKSVIRQMQKDGNLALKYLERKRREEFSTHYTRNDRATIEIDLVAEGQSRLSPKTRKAIAKYANPPTKKQ